MNDWGRWEASGAGNEGLVAGVGRRGALLQARAYCSEGSRICSSGDPGSGVNFRGWWPTMLTER
jgi:hypothetical protein